MSEQVLPKRPTFAQKRLTNPKFRPPRAEAIELFSISYLRRPTRRGCRPTPFSCLRTALETRRRHRFSFEPAATKPDRNTRCADWRRNRRGPSAAEKGAPKMSYVVPSDLVKKMVDAGEAKIFMSARDTVLRAYMAGAL